MSKDETVRTVVIDIEPGSVPDLDVTQKWHNSPRLIRPVKARLILTDGIQKNIVITGGLVLKSGGMSTQVTDTMTYRKDDWRPEEWISIAPDWVQLLWAEAPAGVFSWREVEAQTL